MGNSIYEQCGFDQICPKTRKIIPSIPAITKKKVISISENIKLFKSMIKSLSEISMKQEVYDVLKKELYTYNDDTSNMFIKINNINYDLTIIKKMDTYCYYSVRDMTYIKHIYSSDHSDYIIFIKTK